MPVHTGYDNNKKEEPKCYARWGKTGKKYYYTCNNENARDKAKGKAAAQGRAIIAGGWQEKINKKGDEKMPNKARGAEGSYEEKREKLRIHFEKDFKDSYIIYTFPDAVIIKDYKTDKNYEIEYAIIDDEIKSGEPKEVEIVYILKSLLEVAKDKVSEKGMNEALRIYLHYIANQKWPGEKEEETRKGTELTGPIFKKVEKQRIVYAAVLVPGEPDLDADKGEKILTAEEIEMVAHKWMEEYGNIDYMHGLNNVAKPIETFILPMDWEVEAFGEKMLLPKGTWILAAKVVNDTVWKKVENGELTGFSIMGIQNNVLKSIMDDVSKGERVDKAITAAMKRVLIVDLGKDWLVPFVSLVDETCVPKAKFFAIKKKDKKKLPEGDPNLVNKTNEISILQSMMNLFKKDDIDQIIKNTIKLSKEAEKAGRSISDDTFSKLKNALGALQKLIDKADKEREPKDTGNKKKKGDELEMEEKDVIKLVDERLDEKLKPINEGLVALLPKEEEGEETEKTEKKEADDEDKGKAKKKEDTKEEGKDEEEEGEEEEKDDEKDALKAENLTLKETLDKLQKAKKGLSKAEKGQEDEESDKPYSVKDHLKDLERDSLGRAVKKKEK